MGLPFGTPQRYPTNVDAISEPCSNYTTVSRACRCGHMDCSAFSGGLLRNIGALLIPGSSHSTLSLTQPLPKPNHSSGTTNTTLAVEPWRPSTRMPIGVVRAASQARRSTTRLREAVGLGVCTPFAFAAAEGLEHAGMWGGICGSFQWRPRLTVFSSLNTTVSHCCDLTRRGAAHTSPSPYTRSVHRQHQDALLLIPLAARPRPFRVGDTGVRTDHWPPSAGVQGGLRGPVQPRLPLPRFGPARYSRAQRHERVSTLPPLPVRLYLGEKC